jgi:SAM-dependent methyltransferase
MTVNSYSDRIMELYERHAEVWDRDRRPELVVERAWIERFVALLPMGGSVLDMGCGSGQPIARHLVACGFEIFGVDSSPTLIEKCRARFPGEEWLHADMRTLSLERKFQGLIAWDSFFHLSHDDQRAMFPVFKKHAAESAPLLLTTGPEHGEAIGSYEGEPLYHASLSTGEYKALFEAHGFRLLAYKMEDPHCGQHTVWLAQALGD